MIETKPFLEPLNYYNTYDVSKEVNIPKAYVVKNGWNRVVERLENNQIEFQRLEKDSVMNVVSYHIDDLKLEMLTKVIICITILL